MRRADLALTAAILSLGAIPGVALAQATPARPPGLTGQNIAVDCDVFADGVHEVPIIVVTSPASGATVPPGDVTLQGIAVDCHVEVGAGINRVSAYLGGRDAGGTFLGDAALRQPNPITVLPADQYQGVSGWVLKTKVPLKPGALNELFVYARSEMTNRETVVSLPLMGTGASEAQPPTPSPTVAPTVVPPASTAPAEATAPTAPEAVPLASNAPAEAIVAPGSEPMSTPDDDAPPPPVDEAPAE